MEKQNLRSRTHTDSRQIPSTEPLWTVGDVASFLRLKEETVRMMARANKLPAIKVGRAWRFRSTDIMDMLLVK